MTVLLIAHAEFPSAWRVAFERVLGGEGLVLWPEPFEPERIECAIVARAEPGALSRLPRLKLVSSTGMGVDHILALPDLPADVPVARVVSPVMVDQVAEYATLAVLRAERESDRFDVLQRQGIWQRRLLGRTGGGKLRVGLLGYGVIGQEIARRLTFLGFSVQAWASRVRVEGDVQIAAGRAGLDAVLAASDVLVCALPAAPSTHDLLDRDTLSRLPVGAHVVNVGRGEHIEESALIDLLDNGHLSGATLDVFRTEPLPPQHPFWSHAKVRVTPHSAGLLDPADSAAAILRNIRRVRAGMAPEHVVSRTSTTPPAKE